MFGFSALSERLPFQTRPFPVCNDTLLPVVFLFSPVDQQQAQAPRLEDSPTDEIHEAEAAAAVKVSGQPWDL